MLLYVWNYRIEFGTLYQRLKITWYSKNVRYLLFEEYEYTTNTFTLGKLQVIFRILGSHVGGHEEFYLVGYNSTNNIISTSLKSSLELGTLWNMK
jgi:hypothetical protein